MFDVVSFGEFLIDMVATQRNVSLFDAPAFEPKPGGAPANVAVGAARQGKKVAFIGKLGRDSFGQGLRKLLDAEGIDTSGLLEDTDKLTTLAFVSLSDRGDPEFAIFAGAHTTLKPNELPVDILRQARIFHFSSVTLAHHPVHEATHEAIRIAKANGAVISYDINFRPALYPDRVRGVDIVCAPIPQADILKMNEAELALITGEPDPQKALAKLDVPATLIAVTMAEKGCLYKYDGKISSATVPPVDHVVDATGAGDSFMAALLTGYKQPLDDDYLARVMRRACQAGAIATTKRGAIPSLPYADQLDPLP
ncbi:MAG: carbohydrate kinase [Anaerolineae bacterium]|nr:carbohydrate kinase [Anaerolineae bacterium]